MPVPTLVTDLSTTLASNSPAGSDNVFPSLDDYLRSLSGFIASIRDNSGNGWVSPYLPLTYSAGAANGVVYLNGSKVVTTGSALVFDGTNFSTTGTASATKLIPTGGSATGNGMYLPAANTLAWSTNGAETMRLDSSGNLGIGTTSPATTLHVQSATGQARIQNTTSGTALIGFRNSATTDVPWVGTGGDDLRFTTLSTERARIDASGRLLLNQTSSGLLNSNSFSLESANGYAVWNHPSSAASGSFFHYFGYNAGTIGSITQSGTTAVLYNTTSDQRLKTNIVDAPDAAALIDSIKVRSFDWIADNSHQRYGMVAQELFEVAPEAVHAPADPDEMMAVDYSKLVPMLIKELQSLRARVAALEAA